MKDLPVLPTLGIILIQAPRSLRREIMTALMVQLVLFAPVRVLDGGNCFDGLKVARELRRQTRAYHDCLQRVTVARAFTCYQMVSVVTLASLEPSPILVLELLSTFADENVPLHKRRALLRSCLPQLKRLSRVAPVFISAEFCEGPFGVLLESQAEHFWQLEQPVPAARQERLF